MSNKTKTGAILGVATLLAMTAVMTAGASSTVPQTALPGVCVPQFTLPMPVFGPAGPIPRVDAKKHKNLTVTMTEIDQAVLPVGVTVPCAPLDPTGVTVPNVTFGKTRVWAYGMSDTRTKAPLAPPNWPAVTVQARRHNPTVVTYENKLPMYNEAIGDTGLTGLVQGLVSVDQTVDWTDPEGQAAANHCNDFPQDPSNVFNPNPALSNLCLQPFLGPPPVVPHLHGGEVSSKFDGGPLAWFTPATSNGGKGYFGKDYNSLAGNKIPGKAVYHYPNDQEPGTLWFHDHAMGQTRTNVYSGMAAFYFLEDPANEPKKLPDSAYEIEMAIQDRQFDTSSQLFYPDSSTPPCGTGLPDDDCLNGPPPNPGNHPLWVPEFIGDVAIVNGAPWPVLHVEPRRYRFHLLDGSNARVYNLSFGSVPVFAIGADDNYLDQPVHLSKVFIAPGERSDVIVDFTNFTGQTITVTNDAPVPFPDGLFPVPHPDPVTGLMLPADQPQMASIFRIVVDKPLHGKDKSCDPDPVGNKVGCTRPHKMVRLTDGAGNLAPGVKIDKKRQLILKEFEGVGGPEMVLVNNSQFMGTNTPSIAPLFPTDGISELPQQGSTELWEIINLTVDAHPMHTHLVQFQILNRQQFDTDGTQGSGITGGYLGAWNAAFGSAGSPPLYPGCVAGQFCPGYGPPLPYTTPNADGALGGNPAIGTSSVPTYLVGTPRSPAPEESGWKDTAKAYPGEVLRIVIRIAPTYATVKKAKPGKNLFPFDPTDGPGYVWHCHIIDHEDQDMMRPYRVTK